MIREATIEGPYRYELRRRWADGPAVLFVGLNPSTADGDHDDPTVRRCIRFASRLGCGELLIGNLYGWRATDPRALRGVDDPVGPANDEHLVAMAGRSRYVLAAWGATEGPLMGRPWEVSRLLCEITSAVFCLGTTRYGHPRHPVRLRADAPLEVYLSDRRNHAEVLA